MKSQEDLQVIRTVDSHSEGEPTRVILEGGPPLGKGPLSDRLARFRTEFDHVRSAVVNEPRGSDVMVGALLCEPTDPEATAGVIFFNNVGFLGMCGHGVMGLLATLAHMGRVEPGEHVIETPVGSVIARLHDKNRVTVQNVACYRHRKDVRLSVEGIGDISGDVAWGGNWFFLMADHGQQVVASNVDALTEYAWRTRQALAREGITGVNDDEIDHIELFGPPSGRHADSRNFVLCPGKAYDRSPCGTGTCAKMACLFADGHLEEGRVWRQESIIGSLFEGSVTLQDGELVPRVTGSAFVSAESSLVLGPADPFRFGIRP